MPAPYPFGPILAADPSNTENVAKGGEILIYAPGDPSKAPLALTDLSLGMALPNPLPVNNNGFGPAFLTSLDQVAWEGAGFTGTFESYGAMRDDAEASRQAAEAAQEAAEAAAASAVAPTDEAVSAVLMNPESEASSVIEASIAYATAPLALKPNNGGIPVGKGELNINAKDFGAIGDGIADDTEALNSWLAAGGTRLLNGRYRITSGLVVNGNRRTFITDNATILGDAMDIRAVTITGNYCYVRAHVDGNNKANYGIYVTGEMVTVEGSLVENIYSADSTARGISVFSNGGSIIRNNVIRNIHSVGDDVGANGAGASRAIFIGLTAPATRRTVVSSNDIDNVTGEEGDAIQVLSSGFQSALVTIKDNAISSVSRRFIKIQGSDCMVLRNVCTHNGIVPTKPGAAINIISSSSVIVDGNIIYPNPLNSQISVSGDTTTNNYNVIIRNNIIIRGDNSFLGIYFDRTNNSSISGNLVYGGTGAVAVGICVGVIVSDNSHFGGLAANVSFSAVSSNTGVVMRNNINMLSARTATATNASISGLTELNAKRP